MLYCRGLAKTNSFEVTDDGSFTSCLPVAAVGFVRRGLYLYDEDHKRQYVKARRYRHPGRLCRVARSVPEELQRVSRRKRRWRPGETGRRHETESAEPARGSLPASPRFGLP